MEEETIEDTELSSDLYCVKGEPNEAEASLVAPKEFMATNDSSRAQSAKDQNVKVVAGAEELKRPISVLRHEGGGADLSRRLSTLIAPQF